MTQRLPLSLTLILFTALLFSACTPGTSAPTLTPGLPTLSPSTSGSALTFTPTQIPPIAIDPTTLRGVNIRIWHAFTEGAYRVLSDEVASFNASNEWGIVVTESGYGDYPTLFDAVNSSAVDLSLSGGAPDLVAALPEQTLAWDASGSVVDLTPYLSDPAWGLGVDGSDGLSDFPAVFTAQDNVNGKQLGLPAERSARFLFYNTSWAQELGFANPPTTAAEFRRQACAANASFRTDTNLQNDGYGGWIVDPHWQTMYSWLLAFDGSVADGNVYTFSTDPNLAALQFVKGLFDDHCAWLSTEPTPFDSFARRSALFVSGDLAELPMAVESMSRLKNADDWTLIPFPGVSGRVLVTYGPSYSVLKSTPEKQLAAWLFARWLVSPENQAGWVSATGLLPLRSSLPDQAGMAPQWQAAVADLSVAQGVPQLASWRKVRYVLEDGTRMIFQTNLPLAQLPSILIEMDATAQELNSK